MKLEFVVPSTIDFSLILLLNSLLHKYIQA